MLKQDIQPRSEPRGEREYWFQWLGIQYISEGAAGDLPQPPGSPHCRPRDWATSKDREPQMSPHHAVDQKMPLNFMGGE